MNSPQQTLSKLNEALATCMLVDRHPLRRKIRELADLQKSPQNAAPKIDKVLAEIVSRIAKSHEKFQARLTRLPKP